MVIDGEEYEFFFNPFGHWLLAGVKIGYDVNWSGQELPDFSYRLHSLGVMMPVAQEYCLETSSIL